MKRFNLYDLSFSRSTNIQIWHNNVIRDNIDLKTIYSLFWAPASTEFFFFHNFYSLQSTKPSSKETSLQISAFQCFLNKLLLILFMKKPKTRQSLAKNCVNHCWKKHRDAFAQHSHKCTHFKVYCLSHQKPFLSEILQIRKICDAIDVLQLFFQKLPIYWDDIFNC